jgi:hypothetical protein
LTARQKAGDAKSSTAPKKQYNPAPPEMKRARKEIISEMAAGGFRLAKDHDFLPYQYFLVFIPH